MSTLTDSVDSSFNDDAADHVFLSHHSIYATGSDGPITEWTRENAIRLEEKEKKERAMERELLFVANRNKFYDEADKNYWKAIAELLPNEVPTIEKRKGNKDQEKKPSIVVIQGPKPAPAPTKDTKTSDVAAPSQAAVDATTTEVVAAA
ncbi:hypothetical protein LWI28_028604 [Acer negundo]|uniref:Clathrin light chain n=1 Tax=Acer negundo TaxID=4023 RepID=A0AAD5IC14_ACENE|nr:hypothetical protein LWI28_028604 [Acer negundo]